MEHLQRRIIMSELEMLKAELQSQKDQMKMRYLEMKDALGFTTSMPHLWQELLDRAAELVKENEELKRQQRLLTHSKDVATTFI